MDWVKWFLASVGHLGLWCVIFNRVHATAWPRSTRKFSEKFVIVSVALPILWNAILLIRSESLSFELLKTNHNLTWLYAICCVLAGIYFLLRWMWRKYTIKLPSAVIESKREYLNLAKEIGTPLFHGATATTLGTIPFNQALMLSRQRMTLEVDVPQTLDGLRICQLSDLHFTGQIGIEYFQRIVEEANQFEPDLTVITGDLVDEMQCLDWIDEVLGKLKAKHGVLYVLGNHDRRVKDEQMLRGRLRDAGLMQTSGRWIEIKHGETEILVTGNELPWYKDVESLEKSPRENPGLRILLSHSPDQVDWARSRSFDLMFAGHTHGGQVAFPIIGPIVAPSRYGVLYASGTFQIGDMVMHVSRGISGDEPIRICSPPELGLFTIRSKRLSD